MQDDNTISQAEVAQFARLNAILQELRSEHGCPWDKEQTPESLKKNLIEEVYELIDAIDRQDEVGVIEETGDVYLVITMIASILREKQEHFLVDALTQLNEKLIRRHPHVFGDQEASTASEGLAHWKQMKEREIAGGKRAEVGGLFARVGRGAPPLEKAFQLQKASAKVGFHWDSPQEVLLKLKEELAELEEAIEEHHPQEHIKEELGDLLFVAAILAGSLKIDVSEALHEANNKFLRRFGVVQEILEAKGLNPCADLRPEMEEAWQVAKQRERQEKELNNGTVSSST
ncbi:nucleoside triphosphate pyrophosphohydrolase [Entomospira culicis]|uniref:Nucleoside triphosphate pyrophosphohydrolase n=1 Tax=Entomospira culicis TaxID=2719989 RepID=A0A968KUY9_9SPIO|nr:nucleoside triphosphate pyrophosphohydrolase [Entomospira culicis]NIZ19475.1 nucleoside triphosphate pyrophosphohydrolase [Entomospira culicis]NIZ69620.1 nucleoside triphosphate pyrophosphohydrolase [Entomospira culicis]WDI36731.1 nucleoside triphosphate pyrophosphohydrolase [Entomospira culicis]WDI38360.1 nucleoside triphosphate pyrophosphohydrolase [Entomospira culicis]